MNKINTLPYRLRLPGPTAIPERVTKAMGKHVLSHRGPEFKSIMHSAAKLAQPVIGTKNDVMFFASSGTGMMEASIVNALGEGDRALIISNGQFGERFVAIAAAHGIDADIIDVPWGENVNIIDVAQRLAARNYQAVLAFHNESATGAVSDLAAMGKVDGECAAILIVDSVSGLGGIDVRQDDWGIDILISASQKALMCSPGIGLMSVSAKGWAQIEKENDKRRFFWDLRKARDNHAKDQTTFTTPVTLMAGVNEALGMIQDEGLANVLARHQLMADGLRAGGQALGLGIFTKTPWLSNTVTVFSLTSGLDGSDIVKHMYKEYNTVIAGARNQLSGKVIRIGTMGQLSQQEILTDLQYLEATLAHLGHSVDAGQGQDAAQAIFDKSSRKGDR